MELIKTTINTCDMCAKGTTQAMADGDVIVPDSKPDILKLLQVDSDANITDKYIENGRLVLCGRVDYKVLYIPDSENEKIKSILTSMEFKQIVDASDIDDDSKILSKATVERVEFNAVNSRKMRLRAIVHIDYEVCSIKEQEITCDIIDELVEKKIEEISFENTINISEHDFTIKEKVEIPSGERSINEILKTDVKICDTEYKAVTGKVIIKGLANICILYTDEDCIIRFVESECPFTEVLDTESITENALCDIDYSLLGVMSQAEPDIDGDLREIMLDIDVCASIKATETVTKEMLCDCYIPYKKTVCNKTDLILNNTIERPSLQNTLREIVEIPSTAPAVNGVYNIMANAVIAKSNLERNKIICEGKVEAYILYLTDSPETPVYSIKKDIPFSYMIDCKEDIDNCECELKCTVKHTSYNLSSSNEIELRCLLSIECMLVKDRMIRNIDLIDAEDREKRNGIIIYFASKGEEIWEIGKHYGVPCNILREYNDISEDIIESERKLFIPMS